MARFAAPLALLLIAAPAAAQTQGSDGLPDGVLYYTQAMAPDAVRAVQRKLAEAGAFGGAVDGAWGRDSSAALQTYQQTRDLQVTGEMNQATAAVMGLSVASLVAAGPARAAPPPQPAQQPPDILQGPGQPPEPPPAQASGPHAPVPIGPDALRAVQSRLRDAGFYAGAPDGVWGPGSQAALVQLQRARGLPVTGRIDGASVQALGFDPNNFPPP
jgi:peptidoglycan hydrolase-like protein with peptidoglycan-binding domain